ncbi:MAG TPA: thioredoxin TrxC [Ideonella sp.]|uniref:thioredoxin TrxC n=1 Tax=Ideonella sp. TaxID=1929293 RepID=UPI002CF2BFC0|nr:thioredoxin TrxC [Ideonella sp.]HSI51971.1 thioredoxin TrxC [Ideonella sp.]
MDTEARTLLACPHCGATNRVPSARLAEDPVCGRCGTALADGHPVTLTDANFDAFVRASGLPVVVDFWAEWCGPCRMMAPQFEQAAAQLKGKVVFAKVNSDENPQVSSRYGIRSIPTLLKLQGGQEVARQSGARPAAAIAQFAG